APFIDWTPFFWTWEMKGSFPAILNHPAQGETARELYDAARAMLDRIATERWFAPRAVIGFWPAASRGDDIEIYGETRRNAPLATFHMLRQQGAKSGKRPNLALSDFVAPVETGLPDWLGAFAVTAGPEVHEIAGRYKAAGDDWNAILVQALADRLAEAYAEFMHARVRQDFWGYAAGEVLSPEQVIAEDYRGIRPAHGYPACPDHSEKRTLFRMLKAERNAGIALTESCAMWPAPSVSGLYFSHPGAAYFGVGRIGRDQAAEYAARKGASLSETESWLAPNLAYDPATRDPVLRATA
ncbi:MAG: vitamin B12 dependent-methionine synthase activation domain-containing protein, partial [Pseudomonadota bacterium]